MFFILRALGGLGAAFVLSATFAACSSVGEDAIDDGASGIATAACAIKNAKTGQPMTPAELAKLEDPVAQKLLEGGACATTFRAAMTKLQATDTTNCKREPVTTRFVSEDAQVTGKPGRYRAVVQRTCESRNDEDMSFSISGLTAGGPLPDNFEAIGRDRRSGVFNYYAAERGSWTFFGSSLDYVTSGYDCDANGACTPKAAATQRCAGCHVGGGLVMKELEAPWLHWESGFATTPGVDQILANEAHEGLLGARRDGANLERAVQDGNSGFYNLSRLNALKNTGLKEVLRPLFCTLDINLHSSSGSSAPPATIPRRLFLARALQPFTTDVAPPIPVDAADYNALLGELDAVVGGLPVSGGPVRDTKFAFTYPVPGALTENYVQELLTRQVVDRDFVMDVLAIDFTRPIFSKMRCDLVELAPNLGAAEMTPPRVRDAFRAAIGASTLPGAQALKASLADTADTKTHEAKAGAFLRACAARPKREMLRDAMRFAAIQKNHARAIRASSGQGIIEFEATMSTERNVAEDDLAFDPETCVLK